MKGKILTVCTLFLVPILAVSLTGCKEEVGENSGYVLQDTAVYPAVTAPYEEESKAVLDNYFSVSNQYGSDSSQAQAAAKTAAAQLYAYACYSEEYLDKYVYFSEQVGTTTVGSGESKATKQDYKLIIHESEDTCGYKYHYTIKKVDSASGTLSMFKTAFESCKLRFVTNTDTLYRFSGSDVAYDEDGYLTCTWNKDTSDWGTQDNPVSKREGDKLTIDGIAADIVSTAQDNPSDAVIHGNINILAEDIVSYAYLVESKIENTEETGYTVLMTIDTDIANTDEASLAMLRESNSSDDCKWSDDCLTIMFQIWDNGLFYTYLISEEWSGKISGFSGSVASSTSVTYSYSDNDTDMTAKNEMLAKALES